MEGDREVLLALYWSSGGPRWNRKEGWQENDPDLGNWHGIDVDAEGRVTKLDLVSNGLEGTLPAALGSLSHLVYLRLPSNKLTGPIPTTIGNMNALTYLDLSKNQITGKLPAELGRLKDVSKLDCSCNLITGKIPPSLGDMQGLYTCWLEKNHIEGPIPDELAKIANLTDLDLAENRIGEGRLQGKPLKVWKDEALKRLEDARRSGRSRVSGGAHHERRSSEGTASSASDKASSSSNGMRAREVVEMIVAKETEITRLKEDNARLRRQIEELERRLRSRNNTFSRFFTGSS